LLVNPESVEELVEALRRLTCGDALRADLVGRGKTRSGLFTWEKAVAETWSVYRKLLG
jgi:glycosyltransferase involved in cell wall biosynthesis